MISQYVMTFNTDRDRRVSLRVNRAVPNLPRAVVLDAMDKVLTANAFHPTNGNLTSKHSVRCITTVVTPIDLG